MKLCTKVRVAARQVADSVILAGDTEIIDVSFVEDGHQFGVDADGFLHIEGHVTSVTPA